MLEMFAAISGNLIPVMFFMLGLALILRLIVYTSGKRNNHYFKVFSDGVIKVLEGKDSSHIDNVGNWVNGILHDVSKRLPDRNVRAFNKKSLSETSTFRSQEKETFREFSQGKKSIVHSVKQNIDAFTSSHPPNFYELTHRILNNDKKWTTILGFVNLEKLSRMLDTLPGIFVVVGIFGTFLGITAALPLIAQIDITQMAEATTVLNNFVESVAFSMHTSIAGIVCSLILTILNTLYPIADVRIEVRKNLEYCFEFMWYKVHGEKVPEGDRLIIDKLAEICTLLSDGAVHSPKKKQAG